jgi:hypothetical protein
MADKVQERKIRFAIVAEDVGPEAWLCDGLDARVAADDLREVHRTFGEVY